MEKSDNCCAICKHNQLINTHTFCSNPSQRDTNLRNSTYYNTSCELFKLRNEDFYGKDNIKEISSPE